MLLLLLFFSVFLVFSLIKNSPTLEIFFPPEPIDSSLLYRHVIHNMKGHKLYLNIRGKFICEHIFLFLNNAV